MHCSLTTHHQKKHRYHNSSMPVTEESNTTTRFKVPKFTKWIWTCHWRLSECNHKPAGWFGAHRYILLSKQTHLLFEIEALFRSHRSVVSRGSKKKTRGKIHPQKTHKPSDLHYTLHKSGRASQYKRKPVLDLERCRLSNTGKKIQKINLSFFKSDMNCESLSPDERLWQWKNAYSGMHL